jgi:hypothetical protein
MKGQYVKPGYMLGLIVGGLALSACSKANASELDPSNPLHCATQFQVYSSIARQQGDEKGARGYGARSQWYVDRARSLPAEQRTPEALNELGNRVLAAPDGGLALATECKKRQDADPEFQRLVEQAKAAAGR